MGANLCSLWCPLSDQNSESGNRAKLRSSSFKEFIKLKCMKIDNTKRWNNNLKRKQETDMVAEKKIITNATKLTLQDWMLASPGLKQDYLNRGELCAIMSPSKKKVHPCSSQCRASLLGEAKDSLSLDRYIPMNEENGGILSTCSSINVRSQKRVRFKLPHIVIVYSPDEPYYKEASLRSPEEPYSSDDDSFSPNCNEDSFETFDNDIAEEPYINVKLAVHTLPHVFVSSRNLKQGCSIP